MRTSAAISVDSLRGAGGEHATETKELSDKNTPIAFRRNSGAEVADSILGIIGADQHNANLDDSCGRF
jgi:hypothetical protein